MIAFAVPIIRSVRIAEKFLNFQHGYFDIGIQQSSPFLYIPGGRSAPYITLSHCWGEKIEAKCLSTNLDSYRSAVSLAILPRTFQDVISVTRHLGFQYIWIDALCILQDNPEDWTRKAQKMGEYYRNSTLTIAADDAKSSSEGFLQPRRPTAVHGAPIGVYVFPDGSRRHLDVSNINMGLWTGSKLEGRAWTKQERVLSSRILHYTHKGLFWECRTESWHEAGGSRRPYSEYQTVQSRAEHEFDQQELSWRWESLVLNYSSRQLSVLTDKLPALSGLAAMYKEAHGQKKYLAGIWAHEMPRCLMWSVLSSYKPSEPVLAYRAPSWSWASMNAEVYYPEEEYDMLNILKPLPGFNIVDADVKERSPGSFMHVTEGYIIVIGTLYSARYFNREHQPGSVDRGSLETSFPGLHKGE